MPAPLETLRVLVVEDDPVVLRLCQTVLERGGFRVFAAMNAGEALRMASSTRAIDLALIDILLPGESGARLIEQLRADGMTAPVICMSGYPIRELPGFTDPEMWCGNFLSKPFTPRQLLDAVSAAIR